ncbi:MAG: hypothetical protein ACRDU0_03790 [Mycobacterium sp.]
MPLDPKVFAKTTASFCDLHLLSVDERRQILALLGDDFAFVDAVRATESVHVHVKVDEVAALPQHGIRALSVAPQNQASGYVKYSFPGGINMIFSSIPVAADDLIDGAVMTAKPFMDHAGLDIRNEDPSHRAVFDAVPSRAATLGWRTVAQDGPVHCCHTEVGAKHWVYPPPCTNIWRRPLEIAFGALRIVEASMGCNLRPMDPAHALARRTTGCSAPVAESSPVHVADGS